MMRPAAPPTLTRWASVFGFFFLFACCARYLGWLIVPVFFAVVLFYLLSYPCEALEARGFSHVLSVWIVFSALAIVVCLLMPFLVKYALSASTNFTSDMTRYLEGGRKLVLAYFDTLEHRIRFLRNTNLSETVGQKLDHFVKSDIPHQVPALLLNVLSFLPGLLIAPFTAFYLLRDGRSLKKTIVRDIPNAFFERSLFLFYQMDRQITGFFLGVFIEAVIVGCIIGVGLFGLGAQHFILLGSFAALFNFVPYLGPLFVYSLALIATTTDTGVPSTALWVTLLFLFTKLLDDLVIAPHVLGKSMQIHPVAVVFALYISGEVAGLVGLLLALPVLGISLVVLDVLYLTLQDRRLQARHRQTRLMFFPQQASIRKS